MNFVSRLPLAAAFLCGLAFSATPSAPSRSIARDASASSTRAQGDASSARIGDPYLLEIDPVTEKKLGPFETQIVRLHERREFRFANQQNAATFAAAPAKYIAFVDAKLIEQQRPRYAASTCVVSGEKLGASMGTPVDRIFGNRLVRFCCEACIAEFEKDPRRHLAVLDRAVIEREKSTYAPTQCVVSGEKLGGMGEPVDRVVGNRLVRFCCESCVSKFEQAPLAYFAKLDQADRARAKDDASQGTRYACPMHPDVARDKPGRCPKCGMDLTKKK